MDGTGIKQLLLLEIPSQVQARTVCSGFVLHTLVVQGTQELGAAQAAPEIMPIFLSAQYRISGLRLLKKDRPGWVDVLEAWTFLTQGRIWAGSVGHGQVLQGPL